MALTPRSGCWPSCLSTFLRFDRALCMPYVTYRKGLTRIRQAFLYRCLYQRSRNRERRCRHGCSKDRARIACPSRSARRSRGCPPGIAGGPARTSRRDSCQIRRAFSWRQAGPMRCRRKCWSRGDSRQPIWPQSTVPFHALQRDAMHRGRHRTADRTIEAVVVGMVGVLLPFVDGAALSP